MKKSFLLLPITLAVLTACSSDSPAPVESADGTLSPGMMQPVDNPSMGGNATWEPQIQQSSVPNSMNTPMPQAPAQSAPQPNFQPTYQPQPVQKPQAAPAVQNKPQQTSQDFTIPRNPTTNAPDYSQINKGFYKGNTYTVRKGDTMFLIAYISGLDVKELAALNNMKEPYNLSVGQTLKVSNGRTQSVAQPAVAPQPQAPVQQPVSTEPTVTYTPGANGTQYGSDGTITGPVKATAGGLPPVNSAPVNQPVQVQNQPVVSQPIPQDNAPVASTIAWRWPTSGNVVQGFSSSDGGNKGIDIGGSRGQAVNAAAGGRVVYAGNALRGYGNLIIIKHNDDFLSAYAHNDSILVKDQQEVKAGQQIAKMGNTGTNDVKLHFEIRYKGKSVDPTRYLPRR
ncbi:murein hydrolase activator NlpD [Aggregatibacter segnis]|uniref:Lipoprotein n=1 Tax=Aggregatibacter segnis ATCC 33393 TaxID=888057 RepID=E6L0J3_9PAST|nr:murein hydrolase activator NlpD [Aggregatibacter segnis]EFU66754.1 lipoprotein [Aggregatibacter segnis ATCC 33393]QQB10278.1 murein hydrolase activator NlpD [Aggregatibacter segnis]SQH63931.1 Murein hydrolase activator NlpD precursor [Aggregatibacter segnis ATCC 33393]